MPKFTALAVALLTVMSIVPESQAMTASVGSQSIAQPAKNLQAQLIIKIGGHSDRNDRDEYYRRDEYHRRLEWERAAERRRREYFAQRRYERARYHRDRDGYRGDYRVEYHYGR